ncbi:DUF3631 domain-containing protein [Rhodobacterales bacterium HKCCSP123]|nr:DUF3631 domain-containing protein [Rhodobacterales bacterium HKCCSP123]
MIRVTEIKGEHLPVAFSTWCAMAIAGIGGQRDTLMSRSIVIGLRRRLPEEPVERLPIDLHQQLLRIRRQIARWAADNVIGIGAMATEPPDCGDDRRRDNWTPLHRIATVLGASWPDRIATAYAAQAQAEDEDNEPAGVMLLRDLTEVFAAAGTDRLASSLLVGDLMVMEDRPWAEWRHGKPISAQGVARLMKPFGVKARVMKVNGVSTRAYLRSEVEAAALRYASSPNRNPVTLKENQCVSGSSSRNPETKVTPEDSPNTLKSNGGYAVTPTTHPAVDPDAFDPDAWG